MKKLLLTDDQNERLDNAIKNIADLLGESDDDLVEWLIDVLTGKGDEMGRRKKEQPIATPVLESVGMPPADVQPTVQAAPAECTALITEWRTAAAEFSKWQAKERELRQSLVSKLFDMNKLEGTDTLDVGWGYKLRLTRELSYNATNNEHETELLLNAVGAINPELACSLIRWKPDVIKKVYRDLVLLSEQQPHLKEAMVRAVTLKPGMPQLEMIAPGPDELVPLVSVQP